MYPQFFFLRAKTLAVVGWVVWRMRWAYRKKGLTEGLERCDKAIMLLHLQQFGGLTAAARKAASSLNSNLPVVNNHLVVVLIIVLLLANSGVGLIA